ncbi:hypothetical protein R75465_06840 [Paraburkholderia aspalathi]|nr:hypothetical protein R75465_06840 [Paraburkholderia aspalathi]
MPTLPARFQQQTGRVQIDAHAEIEIRLGLPTHDRGKMEDGRRPVVDHALEHAALGDIAHFRAYTRIAEIASVHHVKQHQFGNRLRLAVLILQ